MRRVLDFIRDLRKQVDHMDDYDPYTLGYKDALALVQEFIEDELWKEGEDASA